MTVFFIRLACRICQILFCILHKYDRPRAFDVGSLDGEISEPVRRKLDIGEYRD